MSWPGSLLPALLTTTSSHTTPFHISVLVLSCRVWARSRGEIFPMTIMNFSCSVLCYLWCVLYAFTECVVKHRSAAVQRTLLRGTSELDQSAWFCQPRRILHRPRYICVPLCTVLLFLKSRLGVASFWHTVKKNYFTEFYIIQIFHAKCKITQNVFNVVKNVKLQ